LKESAFSAKAIGYKFKGKYYNCGKTGHKSTECRGRKKEATGASIGPLTTPGGRKGLSPPSESAMEATWVVIIGITKPVAIREQELLWVIDSGASRHMTYNREAFSVYNTLEEPINISTANGAIIQAIGQGTVLLRIDL